MKRTGNPPATFIATPWTPAGRPNRNSSRMMPQSGRQSMPRCHTTGNLPESNRYTATPLMTRPATVVPTAAPAVPKRGKGPRPVMNATLHAMFSAVRSTPRRSRVRASPGVPHKVSHQGVIDHALEPGDEVLQHRGPGEHPDGPRERAVDDGTVEGLGRVGHRPRLASRLHGPAPAAEM